MRQIVYLVLLLIGRCLTGLYTSAQHTFELHSLPVSGAVFTIGVVLPLSGDFAAASGPLRRGIEAAAVHYSKRVIFEDDGGLEPHRALTAVRKLIDHEHVDLIILSSFDLVPAVASLLQRSKMPALVLWDSNQALPETSPYAFAIGYSPEQAGDSLAVFTVRQLRSKRTAMISADTRWSATISNSFRARLKSEANEIISDEVVKVDHVDFRSYLARILKAKPDVIFAPLYTRGIVSLIRQSRELGYKGAIVTGEVLFGKELQTLGEYAEGVYLTNAWLSEPQLKSLPSTNKEGNVPDTARFALGFDSVSVATAFAQQLKEVRDPLEAFKELTLEGLTGDITFRDSSLSPRYQPIMQIVHGTFQLIVPNEVR